MLEVKTACDISMSPDYDTVTLLYKWDSRHGAIISSASWISWPQAGLWPTCYPPGTPRGHSQVLRSQLKGSRIAPGICLLKHPTWDSWSSRQVLPQFLCLYLSVPCLFIQMVLLDPINVPLGPKQSDVEPSLFYCLLMVCLGGLVVKKKGQKRCLICVSTTWYQEKHHTSPTTEGLFCLFVCF